MIKKILKNILPKSIIRLYRQKKIEISLFNAYLYDFKRYYKYSATKSKNNEIKLISQIIKDYHVIEKGLTMPNTRLGFGQEKIMQLSNYCITFHRKYQKDNLQFRHAIAVILEYDEFHKKNTFKLQHATEVSIQVIKDISLKDMISCCSQIQTTRDDFFQYTNSSFLDFSNSRKSIRNFTDEDIPMNLLYSVLDLSQNAPSACNRQPCRTYIYTDKTQIKQILEIQNGSRGFGHLTNKLIIVTVELGAFANPMERNQAFIDGGIYVMNLLYSIHYYKIGACILNCSNTPEADLKLQNICNIPSSEVFVAMVSCGVPTSELSIASSPRYPIGNVFFTNRSISN